MKTKRIIKMLIVCLFAVILIPGIADAKKYTHRITFDANSSPCALDGYLYSTKVKDKKTFTIYNNYKARSSRVFVKGYNAYRVKDKKWFVSGKGWMKSQNGAKIYALGTKWTLDKSWTKGCKKSDYEFYAQYGYIHRFWIFKKPSPSTTDWHIDVKDDAVLTLPGSLGNYNGNLFSGWEAYRKNDKKFYTDGHGWQTKDVIKKNNYNKKLYRPGWSYKIDDSWRRGSGQSDYRLLPVWNNNIAVFR